MSDASHPDDPAHLVVETPWSEDLAAEYRERQVTSVGVNASLDLDFLESLPRLERLVLVGVSNGQDHKAVERCYGLRELTLATDARGELDLRSLPALTSLHTEDKRVPPEHIAEMPALRRLRWMNYPSADLQPLAASKTLREVQLDGVRRLRQVLPESTDNTIITSLDLAYGRGRVPSAGLERFEGLRDLSLHAVRLDDWTALGTLTGLRSLGLVSCGPIEDLEWVRGLSSLAHIALHGTPVLSGDLSPLDDLPSVKTRYVQPRSDYNRVFADSVTADDADPSGG